MILYDTLLKMDTVKNPSTGKTDKQAVLLQVLGKEAVAELDLFEQLQLCEVLYVCQESKSLAEAGRQLFNISREKRSSKMIVIAYEPIWRSTD